jgi:cardiolipin synthase A/B
VGFLVGILAAATMTIVALNFVGSEKRIERRITHHVGVADPGFTRELGLLLGPPIVGGNRVDHFENGAQIFPAMLAAIRDARRSINFETYIYWSGRIGREFAAALAERARAGVAVHVILDWVGSQKIDDELLAVMEDAGVRIERFHPLRWYTLARMNNRTHRKLLVVDGRTGFTGGVGIADVWSGDAQDPDHWRDSHYRLEGPAVAQMQAAFLDNWIETTGEVLTGPDYFPEVEPVGEVRAQLFQSSPTGGADSMQLMYLLSIAAAEHTIDLSAAYFVPDGLTRRLLVEAAHRGARVRVIVPGEHIDADVVRRASRDDWRELLEAGIEISEFQPTMFHCKLLIVDGLLASVGSTNFDNRSFRLNDEANLNVYDPAFATGVTRVFEADLARSRRMSLATWRHRPWRERAVEKVSSFLSAQL